MTDFTCNAVAPDNPRTLHVQNRRARALIELAIETARRYEPSDSDSSEIDSLTTWYETRFWDGIVIDLEELLPSASSRRFWCRVFFDAAHHVLHNRLGNPDARCRHADLICDFVIIARMLLAAAKRLEPEWTGPKPIDWREYETYMATEPWLKK